MNFYQFTPETLEILLAANLTAAEWRMWAYLACHDPWGNNYIDAPETLAIMNKCNIKKSTYYKTIARLQELELYDFQDKGFLIRNLRGNSTIMKQRISQQNFSEISETIPKSRKTPVQEFGNHSEISENFPRIRKPVQENGSDSKILENQTPKPLLRKDSKVSQIDLDLNKKNQNKEDSLSQEKAIAKKQDIPKAGERENLSLFEEWKKTANTMEAQSFEEFVRNERVKAGKGEIMHFPSFMGDKYFPEWLNKWEARKTKNSGKTRPAEYENWTEAQHKEIAREYAKDPITWQSQESWRVKWIEFVGNKYPNLFVEVLRERPEAAEAKELKDQKTNSALEQNGEFETPNSAPPPPNKTRNRITTPVVQVRQNIGVSEKARFALKRRLPDITSGVMSNGR